MKKQKGYVRAVIFSLLSMVFMLSFGFSGMRVFFAIVTMLIASRVTIWTLNAEATPEIKKKMWITSVIATVITILVLVGILLLFVINMPKIGG